MINYKSKLIILRELKLAQILKISKNRIGTTVGHKNIRILYYFHSRFTITRILHFIT